MQAPIITLLTDFGTADGYVGEMKGVLLEHVPNPSLIDITHDIAPQDVDGARLVVARIWKRFPPATVHLIVVDPGVGSDRAALAVESEGRFLVGPDNGVLSPALLAPLAQAVRLPIPPSAAPTFHGRDVFAPAAASLAAGVPLTNLGEPFAEPVILRTPEPRRLDDGTIEGEVIAIDRFGNAITNLVARRGVGARVRVGGGEGIPVVGTYAEVEPGETGAIMGSSGLLEIAVRNGSAREALGLKKGARVLLR